MSPTDKPLASLSRRDDGVYLLRGELSFHTVSPLLKHSAQMFKDEAQEIVVDLTEVGRADSAGLSLLVEWWRQARADDKRIRYRHLPQQMLAMARVGGVDEILPLEQAE